MNPKINELIQSYVEGEIDPASEKEALLAIAEDEEAREMLRLEFAIRGFFFDKSGSSGEVPEGFADRVMKRIVTQPAKAKALHLASIRYKFGQLFKPFTITLKPVYAIGFIILIAIAALLPIGLKNQSNVAVTHDDIAAVDLSDDEEVYMRFVYVDDEASQVAVAGDFTDWKPVELSSQRLDEKLVWTGILPISRGEHRYMFVVDDREWVSDPLALIQRDDGFGNRNAVIVL